MTTHKIDPNQREDLRNVYLAVHGSAITTDIPDVAAKLNLKRQYVKELIGVLEGHKDTHGNQFVYLNLAAGEENNDTPHDWYSTHFTIDDHSAEDAAAWFDAHFPIPTPQDLVKTKTNLPGPNATGPKPVDGKGFAICLCGCTGHVNKGRNYRPGHDARHAGMVARQMAEFPGVSNTDKRASMLDVLPTDALRWKAATMADRLLAKNAKQRVEPATEQVAKVVFEQGTVKSGRWTYEAERNSVSGGVTYKKKNDPAWHVATDKVAATFTPKEA